MAATRIRCGRPRRRHPRPEWVASAGRHRLRRDSGDQLLPSAQRHDAVAAAGDLSRAEGPVRPEFRPDRPGDPGLPDYRLAAAAAGRALRRPPPDAARAAGRHTVQPRGPGGAVGRPQLSTLAPRGLSDGGRLVGVPSGILARGAHGGRRPAWPRAVAVPGRRQRRPGARSPGCRPGRRALGAIEPRCLRPDGAALRRRAVERRPMVQASWLGASERGRCTQSGSWR
jgi:hypothetical protein